MRNVKLARVLDVQSGFAFKTMHFSDTDGIPLIRIRDLSKSSTETNYLGDFREEFIVEPGNYLIGMDGNFRCYRWRGPKALLNQRVCRLRNFREDVDPEYIYYGIQKKLQDIEDNTSFATVKHISGNQIKNIALTLPPLEEQHRIVDILSRAEGIVRLRGEAQKKTEEIIPALFLDMFGDPATNPKEWPIVSLGYHVKISSVVKTPDIETEAEQLCIGPDSIASHTGQIISKPRVYDVKPKSGKYKFAPGEVIYSKIRPYLAKAILADQEGYCSADMYPLQCKQTMAPEYLLSLLLSRAFTIFASASSVRAQMPKLNRKTLFVYRFPLPPINLQKEFVQHVELIRSIQSQQSIALQRAEASFDALLEHTFKEN